jgi:hypothetical protein
MIVNSFTLSVFILVIKKPPPKGRLQLLGRTVGEEREEVLAQ